MGATAGLAQQQIIGQRGQGRMGGSFNCVAIVKGSSWPRSGGGIQTVAAGRVLVRLSWKRPLPSMKSDKRREHIALLPCHRRSKGADSLSVGLWSSLCMQLHWLGRIDCPDAFLLPFLFFLLSNRLQSPCWSGTCTPPLSCEVTPVL